MPRRPRAQTLWTLFYTMLYISACTFGGGFVIVTFMQHKFVEQLNWLSEDEMLDMTALAQSCPGAITVNAAIQVGWRVGGLAGMLVAVLGAILPPLVLLSLISYFYAAFAENRYVSLALKGMQAGVAAVIFDVVLTLGAKIVKTRSVLHIALMLLAFGVCFFTNVNVVLIILAGALVGVILAILDRRKGARP